MNNTHHDLFDAVEDAFSDISAHHNALFLTYLELTAAGRDPVGAVSELSHRSGEDPVLLCHILLDELQRHRAEQITDPR